MAAPAGSFFGCESTRRVNVFAHGIAVCSVFRFMIETVRDDRARNSLGPLLTSQRIALAVLAG